MDRKLSVGPRIAIGCSGLGHVQRGIESWASDLTRALHRVGADVTLFGAGARSEAGVVALPTFRRSSKSAIAMASGLRHFGGWRCGLGSPYDVEQTSFAAALWQRVRRNFDIVHLQDPMLAIWLQRAHRIGLSRPSVVYANGTGENANVMRRFTHLQLLTQTGFESWAPHKPPRQVVFMIPNFVDTERFCPGEQAANRARFGLPPDRTVILCCAAIRRHHKRIDMLLGAFTETCRGSDTDAILVIAGGREAETDTLITTGRRLLGERVVFLPDLSRDSMPALYRAADAFVLPSLHEMFGIVLVEALATGLPVLCNDTPDFRAIVGPGGLYRDLSTQGKLASGLSEILNTNTRLLIARSGRSHVEARFSEKAVVGAVLSMYQSIQAKASRAR